MKIKKAISIIGAATAALSMSFCSIACSNGGGGADATPPNTDAYDIPQDYCRTYYEVFVRSFADSDRDNIGDIKGLINNLDYLNDGDDSTTEDLGINGIWMMPINSSPSYHKYDVSDYYDIDDEYGTLDDFDELVTECNKRGIWLQMDLVLNHTSSQHPDFVQAVEDARRGLSSESSEYMAKYVFATAEERAALGGTWQAVSGTDLYYLANFSVDMPDVNLANAAVREEIKNIVDFWLERGIRSFRLDAVPWAMANAVMINDENVEFWTWFNDYCNAKGAEVFGTPNDGINRYCYNVGEVWTTALTTLNGYFGTGMSNFNYNMGGSSTVGFANATNGYNTYGGANVVAGIANCQATALQASPDALLSNFLSNHDNDRSAGYFGYDQVKIKKAAGLYLLAPGNPYIYYGEEIGAAGSGNDPNKRLAFNWGDKRDGIEAPPGANYTGEQRLGPWSSQTENADSVLTYYRNAIKLRNRFPEIGRGVITAYALDGNGNMVLSSSEVFTDTSFTTVNATNKSLALYKLEWNGKAVFIAQNIGTESQSADIGDFGGWSVVGTLKANGGNVTLDNGTLTLSAGTVAVLKAE